MTTRRAPPLVLLLAAALLAGCGGTRTRTIVRTVQAPVSAGSGDLRIIGQIRSLTRVGDHYELRFDPQWFLSGITANVALAQDMHQHCKPSACPPVPNDNYRVDESHRTYLYLLPANAHGTVLTRKGSGPFPATRITAAQLAELVAGRSPLKLFEPLSSGVWLLVHVDTVRSFAQQYVP
jgi:hypothetical protein